MYCRCQPDEMTKPGGYTCVSEYTDWIEDVIMRNGGAAGPVSGGGDTGTGGGDTGTGGGDTGTGGGDTGTGGGDTGTGGGDTGTGGGDTGGGSGGGTYGAIGWFLDKINLLNICSYFADRMILPEWLLTPMTIIYVAKN